MTFKEGALVGPYTIIEQLGRGGMATVFKAYHANLDRYVALKVLHPAFMEDPNFLARFEREAKVVAKLDHPNIIPVYDFAHQDNTPYLVMKYVEGPTLKARLQQGPLVAHEGLTIIETVGRALAYAHKQGILHRDIKPSNIILANEGTIYLADFGLARIAASGESTLSSDMMVGTPQYISPEQAMGKKNLDEGTDIYSLGVLIYELVVGQVPFIADTPFSIVHDHIYKPLPLPRSVNPNVPEPVQRVLLKALAKERGDRFVTVDEMVAAFKRAAAGEQLPDMLGQPLSEAAMAGAQTPPPGPPALTPPPAAAVPMQAAVPAPASGADKKKRRWWLALLLIPLFCLCAILVNQPDESGRRNPWPWEEQATFEAQTAEALPSAAATETPSQFASPTPVSDALLAARVAVQERPEDPYAHLDLAAALLDDGQQAPALRAFETAESLAAEEPGFFLLAGDMFLSRELWTQAVAMYSKAVGYGADPYTPGLADNVHQALFFAAESREFSGLNDDVDLQLAAPFSQYALDAARARYAHKVLNDLDAAVTRIHAALDAAPEDPVVRLEQAEVFWVEGQLDTAAGILRDLISGVYDAPAWVQVTARRWLNEIEG
ncbi:MAG: serine/threonine protein kinase [Anaerolineae bacterium]|nr:MAG: serine/threonine protein kinase [Anaerolineae bacterium]